MKQELTAIIRRALGEARAAGKDYLTQTEESVKAVLQTDLQSTGSMKSRR